MLSVIALSKKVTTEASVLISQKTNGSLGNLHVGDSEKGGIRADILYLISHYFQKLD